MCGQISAGGSEQAQTQRILNFGKSQATYLILKKVKIYLFISTQPP